MPKNNQALAVLPASLAFEPATRANDIRFAHDSVTATERDYLRKVVVFGLILIETKDALGHAQFGPWLQQQCFADLDQTAFESAWRNMRRWMETARAACALNQIGHDVRFGKDGELTLHKVLNYPPDQLPKDARDVQSQILDFLSGNTQHAIQLEFKNLLAQSGGFRPSKTQLNAWLKKHHPDLIGVPYDDLPPALQTKFRKWLQAQAKLADPKQALQAQYTAALEALEEAIARVRFCTDADLLALAAEADPAKLAEALDTTTEFNHLARSINKTKGKK